MPVYEYACTACGERTEARQSFDDPPLEECPHCGGKLRKLYSPVGIVFKGSGFYSTESKKAARDGKGPSPTPQSEDKGDKKSGGSKGETGQQPSDSKPAAGTTGDRSEGKSVEKSA
jgi:putative FmdB family regulatory protein